MTDARIEPPGPHPAEPASRTRGERPATTRTRTEPASRARGERPATRPAAVPRPATTYRPYRPYQAGAPRDDQ